MDRSNPQLFNKIVPAFLRGGLTVTGTGRITLRYPILSVALILAIGLLAYQNSRASLEREIINKLNAVADDKAFLLNDQIQNKLVEAKRLASNPGSRASSHPSSGFSCLI